MTRGDRRDEPTEPSSFPWWIALLGGMQLLRLFGKGASSAYSSVSPDVLGVMAVIAVAVFAALAAYAAHRRQWSPESIEPPPTTPARTRPELWDDSVDGPFFR